MRLPKTLSTTEGIAKLKWHVLRMIDDPDYGHPSSHYSNGYSIWDVYRSVSIELHRSIRIAKDEGRRTGRRFIDKEIKDIIEWLRGQENL
tara:strand:+ start:459 stop:728 length:270 start_codon:yes stop_codon:yes gene_type:complete